MTKNCVILIMLLTSSITCLAQQYQAKTDHYAIVVEDLERSASFYINVLGLSEIKDQTGKDHIRWLAFEDGVELHLIQTSKDGISLKKDVHLAVAINDFTAFVSMLDDRGLKYENWPGQPGTTNTRPDGVKQIYLQDPDGYWIEVNDANRF